jgi:ribulose-5-phosphate 4-epimerase/fuculose-1-phosphate aldolase
VLLGGHGVLAVGEAPARALEVCVAVEEAARRATGIA